MRTGTKKKRLVANALFRLGMHARAEAVVQALAEQGVGVSVTLVTQVRLELLKKNPQPSALLPPRSRLTRTVRHHPRSNPDCCGRR
jgi:hypothetical protein